MFAEVIINSNAKALNKTFDYIVPTVLEKDINVGSRVMVPFGNSKKLEDGFVINLKNESEFASKEIKKIEHGEKLTEFNVYLAKLMARKYFCNISDCIKLMLPPGTSSKEITNRIKEKKGSFVYLNKDNKEIQKLIENKKIKSEKHIRVLNFLDKNNGIYKTDLEVLTDVSSSIIKTLEKNGYIKIEENRLERNPFIGKNIKKDKKKILTEEQKKCFDEISLSIENEKFSHNLIYGITGSGKTEVYLQLIQKVFEKNKSSIVLVPEISLTPQMVDRFLARFGENNIAILHSRLSNGERYDEWQKRRI